MTAGVSKSDIGQRIAEALSRTTEPLPVGKGPELNGTVIGVVPVHLRHLQNLYEALTHEVDELTTALMAKLEHREIVKELFFTSLAEHVPEPDESVIISCDENWQVVVSPPVPQDDENISFLDFMRLAVQQEDWH